MTDPTLSVDIELLLAQREWVRDLARRLVGDPDDAEDLAQESLLRAVRRTPDTAGDRGRARAWLASVVRGLALNQRRGEARRARRERMAARGEAQGDDSTTLARAEAQRAVVEAVLALPEEARVVVLARYLEGESAASIARRTDVPQATVRKRLSRALAELRRRLDAEHGGRRERWCALLAPLASETPRVVATGVGLRGVALGVALAVVLAVPFVWLRAWSADPGSAGGGAGGGEVAALGVTPSAPEASGVATLVPAGAGTEAGVREAVPPEEPAVGAQDPEPATTLVVTALDATTREPIAGLHVTFLREGQQSSPIRSEARGLLGETLTTGADGRVTLTMPPGQSFTGWVQDPEGRYLRRAELATPVVAEGQDGAFEVLLSPASEIVFFARVVDGESGAPIVGAEVWGRETRWSTIGGGGGRRWDEAEAWDPGAERLATTDAEGVVAIPVHPEHARICALRAEGYGPLTITADEGREERSRALSVQALRAAALTGTLRGPDGGPLAGLEVGIVAFGLSLNHSDGAGAPGDVRWRTRSDERGRFALHGLPARVPVELMVREDGRLRYSKDLELAPGEERELALEIGPLAELRGVLVGPDGEPLPSVWLEAQPAESEVEWDYLYSIASVSHRARTDGEGRFAFTDLPAGVYRVGPARAGRRSKWAEGGPRVVMPRDEPLTITASAGEIRGVVRSEDGEPLAGVQVSTRCGPGGTGPDADTDAQGRFTLAPLGPPQHEAWAFDVRSGGEVGWVQRAPAIAQPGEELVIEMARGAGVEGRVHDEDGQPADAFVSVIALVGEGGMGIGRAADHFRCAPLLPGHYLVVARTGDGRLGMIEDLELPAGQVVEASLQVAPAAVLVLHAPADWTGRFVRVRMDGLLLGWTDVPAGGSAELALPPGRAVVEIPGAEVYETIGTVAIPESGRVELRLGE